MPLKENYYIVPLLSNINIIKIMFLLPLRRKKKLKFLRSLKIDQYCHSRYLFSLMVFCLYTDFTKKFPPNCNWNWFKKSRIKNLGKSNHRARVLFFYNLVVKKPKSNLKFLATPSISMLDPLSFSNKKNIWEQWHNLWFWKKRF